MKLFIFRTNIETRKKMNSLKPLFRQYASIGRWSLDLEDRDKVLRIEARGNLQENEVIDLVEEQGFYCEALPD